jgi:hypothetical protein
MFIKHIIHVDLTALKSTACVNVKLPEGEREKERKGKRAIVDAARKESRKEHPREALESVFGDLRG